MFISGLLWVPVRRFSYFLNRGGTQWITAVLYAKLTSCWLQFHVYHRDQRMNQFSHLNLDKKAKKRISQNKQSICGEQLFFFPSNGSRVLITWTNVCPCNVSNTSTHTHAQLITLHVCTGLWTIMAEESGREQECRQAGDEGVDWSGTERPREREWRVEGLIKGNVGY